MTYPEHRIPRDKSIDADIFLKLLDAGLRNRCGSACDTKLKIVCQPVDGVVSDLASPFSLIVR